MGTIGKLNGLDLAAISKIDGISRSSIGKINGASTIAAAGACWVCVSENGRIMYSENATGDSGSWTDYQAPDYGSQGTGIAFGKDHNNADQWIITWDRGNNLASVATVSVPTESADWSTLDLDSGTWSTGYPPNDVAWSNGVNPPMWVIAGNGGRVAYSTTGSAAEADWAAQVATTTGFAANRHIEGVCFSGSHAVDNGAYVFLAGAKNRIVSGSVPNPIKPVGGGAISWGTADRAFDENDYNTGLTFEKIRAAGTGSDVRMVAIFDSNNAASWPYFATGSTACCGLWTTGSPVGWRIVVGTPADAFGDNPDISKRKMKDVASDGKGTWMIVGAEGEAYRSTDNCNTWEKMSMSATAPGDEVPTGKTIYAVEYANVNGTDTWMVGGEDGYLAVSTDTGASGSWSTKANPFYDAGAGVNRHIFTLAFNSPIQWPGSTS